MSADMTGAERIAAERQRQIDAEGYTLNADARQPEHMALAASVYATPAGLRDFPTYMRHDGSTYVGEIPRNWPWPRKYYKPTPADRIRELEKAGALIAAEIDRLLNHEATS